MLALTIGKYRIERTIGTGSYGTVVEATDSVLNRTVALKILRQTAASSADFTTHLREARALARLRHPNIVTIFDLDEVEGQIFLAMEHIDGEALTCRLRDGGLAFDVAMDMAWQLADALAAAHRQGVVHADIKPANVILDRQSRPLLVDFGLASLSSRESFQETLADSVQDGGGLRGTISYMPPELFMGGTPDIRSDIFSFGALMFEMLSGRRAFEAASDGAAMHRILNGRPDRLSVLRRDVPDSLCDLVDRMLAANPADRPHSMELVRDTIGTVTGRAQLPVLARPILPQRAPMALARRLRPFRSRAAIAGLGGFALAGVLLVAGSTLSQEAPQSVQSMIGSGLNHIYRFEEKGAITAAIRDFQTVLGRDPNNAAATAGLSLALFRRYTEEETDPTTLKQASAAAKLALSLDGELALSHVAAAWGYGYAGNKAAAYRHYRTALTLESNNVLAEEGLARLYRQDGREADAIALYRKGIAQHPDYGLFYGELGRIYFDRADFARAETLFRKSIALAPDNVYGYANLSAVQHMQGRTADAVLTIQQGLRVRPQPMLYSNLGTYLYFLGQYPQAAQAFERLTRIDGNSQDFLMWGNLADAYRWSPGKEDKARTAYRLALRYLDVRLKETPRDPMRNVIAALYHAKLGERAPAIAALDIALAKPTAAILFQAAVAREILGQRGQALALLTAALKAGYPRVEIDNEPELTLLRQDLRYQQSLVEGEGNG